MEISERKCFFRRKIRNKRKLLLESDIRKASAKTLFELLKTPEYLAAEAVFVYASYQQELSTYPLMEAAFTDGKMVAVPKVLSERHMEFYQIHSTGELTAGYFGIPEPVGDTVPVYPGKNSLLILPGMLFDCEGRRMGYGGGFYDSYIAMLRERGELPLMAGYSYDFQIFGSQEFWEVLDKNECSDIVAEGFPAEEHDEKADMLVTPSRVIYV